MLTEEQLLPVPAAVERATGRRIHPTTCHRWRLRGINGVRLETLLFGGRRMTSVEAVRRFLAAGTLAADGTSPALSTPRGRDAAVVRADKELYDAGF